MGIFELAMCRFSLTMGRWHEITAEKAKFMVSKHTYEYTDSGNIPYPCIGARISHSCYYTVILRQQNDLPFLITNEQALSKLRVMWLMLMCDPVQDVRMLRKNFPGSIALKPFKTLKVCLAFRRSHTEKGKK